MQRTFVVAIQLNLFWDTLLFYENACANAINSLQFFRRRNLPHSYRCHSYPLEIKELNLVSSAYIIPTAVQVLIADSMTADSVKRNMPGIASWTRLG